MTVSTTVKTVCLTGCLLIALLIPSPQAWADGDMESGPKVGDKVPALKVFDVTGLHESEQVDYVAKRGDKPTIYLLLQAAEFSRPIARFMKAIDTALEKSELDAYQVAVWLTDDHEKTKEYLPRGQNSLKLQKTALTYYEGEKTGPENWSINDQAFVTIVVVDKNIVIDTFGYISINATVAPDILKTVPGLKGK